MNYSSFWVWVKLLIETKNEIYYKFINMNVMALQNLLVLTFENYSKMCGFFNPLFIIKN
jgi:hypothetical protein